ncbi:MAG: glyoxylate/hydroxypyruvate reductase A [Cellulophaga sp.]
MSIVIIRQDNKIPNWLDAIKTYASELRVYDYTKPHPKEEITTVLVWKQPQGVFLDYPNLKCIASMGAGVDFIFDDKSLPENVVITRVVDPMLAEDMSEFVASLIFNHLKRLNNYKIEQQNGNWNPIAYQRIRDISIGIMGMGKLGTHTASYLEQLNFKVSGWANSPKKIDGIKSYTGKEELSSFLKNTSVLICLLPLTKDTFGIINKNLLSELPKGAFVINVARGGHVIDEELLEMISNGHISGASLDVFDNEPLAKEHPFWNTPEIHITPHIASVSNASSVIPQIVDNYRRLENGKTMLNTVSSAKGY